MKKISSRQQHLLAQETGAVIREWGHRYPVALIYPNTYEVGMSNLGFQAVYRLLNDHPDLHAERAFLPPPAEAEEYRRTGTPLLSLESGRPLTDFAALAFSLSFEADYAHVLTILEMARLPLAAAERDDRCPLVVAGGVAAFLNPEPLALFLDALCLGEGEATAAAFFAFLEAHRGLPRAQVLRELAATLPGVYVPAGYTPEYGPDGTLTAFTAAAGYPLPVAVPHMQDLDACPTHSEILAPESEFGRMYLLEVNRGCPRGCRFCAAGYVYRPPRERSGEELAGQVAAGLRRLNKIGLVGTAVSDAAALKDLCRRIVAAGGQLGLSSLRADKADAELFELLAAGGMKSAALAPEAGSERLRRVINKGLTEEEIARAVLAAQEAGIPQLKLYFMVGLPTETREDVHQIAALVKRLMHALVKAGRGRPRLASLTVSLSSFVPKPVTPFQWAPFAGVGELKERIKMVKRELAGVKAVRVYADLPKWAYIQALLSRGDRRVGELLRAQHRAGGDWNAAFRASPVNPDFFVRRPRGRDELLPWDVLDHGVKKDYLWEEYQRGLEEKLSPPCEPEVCRRCGVCGE